MEPDDIKNVTDELETKLSHLRGSEVEAKYKQLASNFGLPFLNLKAVPISTEALSLLEETVARSSATAVINRRGSTIVVAIIDPENDETKKVLAELESKKFKLKIVITTPDALEMAWSRYRLGLKTTTFDIGSIQINESQVESLKDQIRTLADIKNKIHSISVTQSLEVIIAGGLKLNASDIHFEPLNESVAIRYRIDGILGQVTDVGADYYEKMVNRIKIVSKLKINIHSRPQDGRFTIKEGGYEVEVRVSILPSEFGETIVMRLLDPRAIKQDLGELGIGEHLLDLVKKEVAKPHGAIITTGPTGSGKTTALYAFLNYINSPEIKIITIEDPIEYHLRGISQTQVDNSKGYDFSSGLRSIVRQDPDVILVGEIRDQETADITINAALTGHLVFSTLHTNDSAGAIPRLLELKVQPDLMGPAINMILAQRLVRLLCPKCKTKRKATNQEKEKIKIILSPVASRFKLKIDGDIDLYSAGKCPECHDVGYKGRIGIFEGFTLSPALEKLLLGSPTITEIRDLTINEGMVTLNQDAYMKLLSGVTSIEEIERVIQ